MIELNFSIMDSEGASVAPLTEALLDFAQKEQIHTNIQCLAWDTGQPQLVNFALFQNGPDVSEMGTTWLSSFVAMDTVRPFNGSEIRKLGGPATFLPMAWETGLTDGQVWSIPWVTGPRVIYYRRDLLAKAGVDEQVAFQTFEQLTDTLTRLKASGVALPWVIPSRLGAIYMVASWVWHAGGNFMSPDGRRTRFNEPEARTGIANYFKQQFPFLAPAAYHLTDGESFALFENGQAAATISGHWLLNRIRNGSATQEVTENLGMAVVPGIPFMGGSNLVIWNYSHQKQAALKLVEALTSYEVQSGFIPQVGFMPARLDALASPPFTTDPHFQILRQSVETGRTFTASYLWGTVEEKFSAVIHNLWSQLFADPELDIDKAIAEQLGPLAARLDRTLSGSAD